MPVQPKDYALVIGIDHYPAYRELKGAINDAMAFAAWLRDTATGGGVPAGQCETVFSDPEPAHPIQDDIDKALSAILKTAIDAGGGRRLYLYFAGHGMEFDRSIALCLAQWSAELFRNAALDSGEYVHFLRDTGLFPEIAVFLDCCRIRQAGARGLGSTLGVPRPGPGAPAARDFVAYATEALAPSYEAVVEDMTGAQPLVRGHFTVALLRALHGEAADLAGGARGTALKKFLEEKTTEIALAAGDDQMAEVANDLKGDPVFGNAKPLPPTGPPPPGLPGPPPPGATPPGGRGLIAPGRVTPAPLTGTALTHEYYRDFAEQMSLVTTRPPIRGLSTESGQLFVFVRAIDDQHAATLAARIGAGLSLRGTTGFVFSKFTEQEVGFNPEYGRLAFSVELPVGYYLLSTASGPNRPGRRIGVEVFAGFQTQVFLLQTDVVRLQTARIFTAPIGRGFHRDDPATLAADAAIDALGDPRVALNHEARALFGEGLEPSPMLDLLTAHLALRVDARDPFEAALKRLRELQPGKPDVSALVVMARAKWQLKLMPQPLQHAPMLLPGLRGAADANAAYPGLIPADGLADNVLAHLLPDSVWASWRPFPQTIKLAPIYRRDVVFSGPKPADTGTDWIKMGFLSVLEQRCAMAARLYQPSAGTLLKAEEIAQRLGVTEYQVGKAVAALDRLDADAVNALLQTMSPYLQDAVKYRQGATFSRFVEVPARFPDPAEYFTWGWSQQRDYNVDRAKS